MKNNFCLYNLEFFFYNCLLVIKNSSLEFVFSRLCWVQIFHFMSTIPRVSSVFARVVSFSTLLTSVFSFSDSFLLFLLFSFFSRFFFLFSFFLLCLFFRSVSFPFFLFLLWSLLSEMSLPLVDPLSLLFGCSCFDFFFSLFFSFSCVFELFLAIFRDFGSPSELVLSDSLSCLRFLFFFSFMSLFTLGILQSPLKNLIYRLLQKKGNRSKISSKIIRNRFSEDKATKERHLAVHISRGAGG